MTGKTAIIPSLSIRHPILVQHVTEHQQNIVSSRKYDSISGHQALTWTVLPSIIMLNHDRFILPERKA